MTLGRTRFLIALLAVSLFATFFVPSVKAQDQSQMMRICMVRVNPGQGYAMDEGLKLLSAAYKKSGAPWFQVWRPALFGEMNIRVLVSPVKNMAQFDGEGPVSKLSSDERDRFLALWRTAMASNHCTLNQQATELSLSSERSSSPAFARVTTVRVKAGKALDFEALVKNSLLPTVKKNGVKDFWANRTVLGGPMGEYTFLQLFDKWAETDNWKTGQAFFGDAATFKKWMEDIATVADTAETMVARTVPELSYQLQQ